MDKAGLVAAGSSLAASAVVYNVWQQKQQFYPTVVHISKSSTCMAVLYVQAFSMVVLLGHIVRKVFFGNLRAAETEHLVERSWYALTETCLAFTVFRDDLSPSFVAQFTMLLFLKAFHWLLEDRIDFMERSPVIGWLFHLRGLTLMSLLAMCDCLLLSYAAHITLKKGATVHLVFGFEYVVLLLLVLTIVVKYVLHLIDLRHENQWANKTIYLLYTELIIGGVKVLTYALFVTIMIRVHTFPLFVIRPMYLSLRQFQKTLIDVIKSRMATSNMNERYPDATAEELETGDSTCIICREEMTAAKKLPCGHIFHLACLRSWLQRQQTCPTCRIDVLQNNRPGAAGAAGAANPPAAAPQPPPGQPAPPPPIFQWNQPPAAAAPGAAPPPQAPFFVPPQLFHAPHHPAPSPFSFQGFPPMPPPPMSSLSDEELRALEGSTRAAIENRLLILKNVQMLMDAVQAQMQLYNMVSASHIPMFVPDNTTQHTPEPTPASTSEPGPSDTSEEPGASGVSVQIDGEMRTFATQADLDDVIEERRDDLLKTYNLIDDEDVEARRLEREQLRQRRLDALKDTTAGPSNTEGPEGSSEGPEGSSELRKRNVEQREA